MDIFKFLTVSNCSEKDNRPAILMFYLENIFRSMDQELSYCEGSNFIIRN